MQASRLCPSGKIGGRDLKIFGLEVRRCAGDGDNLMVDSDQSGFIGAWRPNFAACKIQHLNLPF